MVCGAWAGSMHPWPLGLRQEHQAVSVGQVVTSGLTGAGLSPASSSPTATPLAAPSQIGWKSIYGN